MCLVLGISNFRKINLVFFFFFQFISNFLCTIPTNKLNKEESLKLFFLFFSRYSSTNPRSRTEREKKKKEGKKREREFKKKKIINGGRRCAIFLFKRWVSSPGGVCTAPLRVRVGGPTRCWRNRQQRASCVPALIGIRERRRSRDCPHPATCRKISAVHFSWRQRSRSSFDEITMGPKGVTL